MRKSAIITGATSGIGRALAAELARRGYDLGLTGRREEVLREIADELGRNGRRIEIQPLDVRDVEAVSLTIPQLADALGGVGMVVANAGVSGGGQAGRGGFEKARETIETNLIGGMATVDAATRVLQKQGDGGQIVGISSVAAFRGIPGNGPYCASKSGFSVYLESVRAELRRDGITVTTLSPGYIDTPLNRHVKNRPFVVSVEDGARKMADLIESRVESSTVPPFPWGPIGAAMRSVPDFLWYRAVSPRR